MLTTQRVSFRCEVPLPDDAGWCGRRFTWLGPAREAHTRDTERADTTAALAAAEALGWWFGDALIACPRHAAPITPEDAP